MVKTGKFFSLKKILIFLLIFLAGAALYLKTSSTKQVSFYRAFVSESFDKIKENYWDNLSDEQILDLFKLSIEKATGSSQQAKINSKEELLSVFIKLQNNLNEEQKKQLSVNVVSAVLANLNPPGRSGLFTQKQEEQLKNTVENINPEKDLYKDLGLSKGASPAAIEQAFQKKSEDLKKETSPEAKQKLEQIAYARDVLGKNEQKQRYDEKGVEPAVFIKLAAPQILYLQFKKFTPTSLDEFQKALEAYQDNSALQALIFDLRGNVGGAIDATAYFLGYFLGKGQYAFDFYKKGEYLPFKTQTDKLPAINKFKQMVILVDKETQSSAEMMAASLKKYHTGVVVGTATKGWGTVERVFPLQAQIDPKEKYSVFLVHSITLRDDNLPIEGRGVEPDININSPDWQNQLFSYFRNSELISAVKQAY